MTLLSRRNAAIVCFVISLTIANGSAAQTERAPDGQPHAGALVAGSTQTLPLAPTDIVFRKNAAYVIGSADGTHQILQVDPETLDIVGARDLPIVPQDLAIGSGDGSLYVAGTAGGASELLILDPALEIVARLSLKRPIARPVLSLSRGNLLLIAGMETDDTEGGIAVVDVSTPSEATEIEGMIPGDYDSLGVTGAWLQDGAEPIAFLNTGLLPTLVAFGIGPKGALEFGDVSFDARRNQPQSLSTLAIMAKDGCESGLDKASFLIVPPKNDALFLVSFDPVFRSLDIVTSTPTAPDEPSRKYGGTNAQTPTALLASSCNQGVIWLGYRHSSQIEQFTLNTELMLFEKIGTLELETPPSALAISDSGHTALAISTETATIARFQSDNGNILGTEMGRSLQRLLAQRGYSVGAIDGQIGTRTLGAVQRFEAENDVRLDVGRDLEGAIQKLENIPFE